MRGGRTRRGAARRPASQTKPGSDPDEVGDNDQRQKGGDAANDIPSGPEAEETQQPAPSKPAPVVSKAKGNKRRGTAAVAAPTPAAAKKNQKAKASSAKSDPTPAAEAKKTTDQPDPAVVEGRCDKGQSEAEAELKDGAEGSATVDDKGGEDKSEQGEAMPSSAEEPKAAAGRRGRKGKAQPAAAVAEKPPTRGSSRSRAAVKYVADDNDGEANDNDDDDDDAEEEDEEDEDEEEGKGRGGSARGKKSKAGKAKKSTAGAAKRKRKTPSDGQVMK